jgi:hypothetical protein
MAASRKSLAFENGAFSRMACGNIDACNAIDLAGAGGRLSHEWPPSQPKPDNLKYTLRDGA